QEAQDRQGVEPLRVPKYVDLATDRTAALSTCALGALYARRPRLYRGYLDHLGRVALRSQRGIGRGRPILWSLSQNASFHLLCKDRVSVCRSWHRNRALNT